MHLVERRIFIVEDNLSNGTIMKILLEASGATVFVDRWGKDTPRRLRQAGPIDLVLMDLMLAHNQSGYDVYDQLQRETDLAGIPVVVVSASDAALELNKARQKGFQGYISKPINNLNFAATIARVLGGEQVWAEDL